MTELLASLEERLGMRSYYWLEFAIGALELGRPDELLAAHRRTAVQPLGRGGQGIRRAGVRTRGGGLRRDRALPPEAIARQRLAEQHFAAGARAEGEAELERALAFWRSVGATAYLDDALALAS